MLNNIKWMMELVDQEVPTGVVDGVNVTYQLSKKPHTPKSALVMLNGNIQYNGVDWTMNTEGEILFAFPPALGSCPYVFYLKYRSED